MKSKIQLKGLLTLCVLLVCALHIQAECITSSETCQNIAFPASKTGTFTTTFQATPTIAGSQLDVVVGLSSGQATAAGEIAVGVRFHFEGQIITRNGSSWDYSGLVHWTAGTVYSFRLVVNVATQTFDAYVTPAGGTEVTIGTNQDFRVSASSLAYWSVIDIETKGSVSFCEYSFPSAVTKIKADENGTNLSASTTSSQMVIKYQLNEPGKATLSLYDMSGKCIRTIENGDKAKGVYEKAYDISDLPNGAYFIELNYNGSSESFKLLK